MVDPELAAPDQQPSAQPSASGDVRVQEQQENDVATCIAAEEMLKAAQLDICQSAPALLYSYQINHVTGVSSFPFCNDYCEELIGVPAKDVMADPAAMVNLVHPDDVLVFKSAVVKSMSDLSLFDQTLRLKNAKSGEYKILLDRSLPYRDAVINPETGELETVTIWKGFIIEKPTLKSNTERGEETSASSLLMDSPLIPFFSIQGSTGIIQEWNKVMTEVTGFQPMDVQGKHVHDMFMATATASTSPSNHEFLSTLLETPKLECTVVGKTGNDVHLILSASRQASSSTSIHILCQDITQLMEVTKQRNEATKLAESERSLTEWLSHEIRNPLSVVMEAAQTLEAAQYDNNSVSNTQHHDVFGGSYLQLIRHSISYVVDILTNMLDLNQLAEGKMILRPETCRLREDILLPTKQMMCLNKEIPVEIEGPSVTLFVDKLRLKQVFANLISNSMKYTRQGKIRISIHLPTPNESFLTIKVSDSGVGIQPAQYPLLFRRFEKLGSSVNGAGIGLCLVKNLLTSMGGNIYLNKEYHSGIPGFPGAQLVVQVPHNAVKAQPQTPAFDVISAALIATAATTTPIASKTFSSQLPKTIPPNAYLKGRYRILVVDDELVGQKLLVKRFQRIFPDATIDSTASGEKAVEMAQATKYDLITMDHYMKVGEMTGSETICELRNKQVTALIAGISGNAMREQHLKAGADEFFQKPLPTTDVVIRRLFGKLPPPSKWRVLLVDDAEVNLHIMERKLRSLAVPHAIEGVHASGYWEIGKCIVGACAKALLDENEYDMVVTDQNLGSDDITGSDLCKFGRKTTKNKTATFVLNSGSSGPLSDIFDLRWSKPLPSIEDMRRDLYSQLLCCPQSMARQ